MVIEGKLTHDIEKSKKGYRLCSTKERIRGKTNENARLEILPGYRPFSCSVVDMPLNIQSVVAKFASPELWYAPDVCQIFSCCAINSNPILLVKCFLTYPVFPTPLQCSTRLQYCASKRCTYSLIYSKSFRECESKKKGMPWPKSWLRRRKYFAN